MPPLLLRDVLLPFFVCCLLFALLHLTALDFIVSDYFYQQQRFIGQGSWWADRLIHKGGGKLIFTVALTSLIIIVASFVIKPLKAYRLAAIYIFSCIALGTGIVNGLKAITNIDCPWDLQRYGGLQPYIDLFSDKADHLKRGRCFPAGHASGAYALFGFYFLARHYRTQYATKVLLAVMALGIIFGVGQWARGAHFPSHDVVSAFICWITALILAWRFGVSPDYK